MENSEQLAQVVSLYDEWLLKTEKRGISYGELAYIQGLDAGELAELENEITSELYSKDGTDGDFFAVCGYGKAELLEDYHKEENGNNEDKTN